MQNMCENCLQFSPLRAELLKRAQLVRGYGENIGNKVLLRACQRTLFNPKRKSSLLFNSHHTVIIKVKLRDFITEM